MNTPSANFLSNFNFYPYEENTALFVFLKLLSLNNKELLENYIDKFDKFDNPQIFDQLNIMLNDDKKIKNEVFLTNIKKVLNHLFEKINKKFIHLCSLITMKNLIKTRLIVKKSGK